MNETVLHEPGHSRGTVYRYRLSRHIIILVSLVKYEYIGSPHKEIVVATGGVEGSVRRMQVLFLSRERGINTLGLYSHYHNRCGDDCTFFLVRADINGLYAVIFEALLLQGFLKSC